MKLINTLLAALILLVFISSIFRNKNTFLIKYNHQKNSSLYQQSQFAPNTKERRFIIQDEKLYAYSGWEYLKTGKLDKINIEHPPLGKYFIGLSILIFKNQNIGQIFWGFLFLMVFYCLCLKITKNKTLSLLVVFLLLNEGLFKEQITHSLLDISQGVFLLIFLLSSLGSDKKRKAKLIIQGLSLGAVSSIKYPTIAFVALTALIAYYFFKKDHPCLRMVLNKLTLIISVMIIVFLLSYLPFFNKNPNPAGFINLQIKALKIHLSHLPEYPKGQVFNVLFLNRWLTWWGEKKYIKTEFWNLLWPILTINFLISLIFFKKMFKKNLLINSWSLFYLIFLSSRLFFPRYLFLLIPFLYLHLGYNIKLLFCIHLQSLIFILWQPRLK